MSSIKSWFLNLPIINRIAVYPYRTSGRPFQHELPKTLESKLSLKTVHDKLALLNKHLNLQTDTFYFLLVKPGHVYLTKGKHVANTTNGWNTITFQNTHPDHMYVASDLKSIIDTIDSIICADLDKEIRTAEVAASRLNVLRTKRTELANQIK
jgi:hypothetical protein